MVADCRFLMTKKTYFNMTYFNMSLSFSVGTCAIIMLVLSSTQGELYTDTEADVTGQNRRSTVNKTFIQDSQRNQLKPGMINSIKSKNNSKLVKSVKLSDVQGYKSFGFSDVSMKKPMADESILNANARVKKPVVNLSVSNVEARFKKAVVNSNISNVEAHIKERVATSSVSNAEVQLKEHVVTSTVSNAEVQLKEPVVTTVSNAEVHMKDGKLQSAKTRLKDLKIRKVRSPQTTEALPLTNQTTLAPPPDRVQIGVISPTPVLTALKSDPFEEFEHPHEVQDDKNEDMLNILNARGFSYTVLPDDMMSQYPDIVKLVDAQEMELGETGHGSETAEGETAEGEGQGSETAESDGEGQGEANENEGNDQEGNEAGEQENEQGDNEKPETPDSESNSANETESESDGTNSEHGEQSESELQQAEHSEKEVELGKHESKLEHGKNSESGQHGKHWNTDLQSSMTEISRGTTEPQHYSEVNFDYQPYYNQLEPGQTQTATAEPFTNPEMHQLHNVMDANSGQKPTSHSNQRHQLPNEGNTNSGQKPTSRSNQRHQLPNEGNPNSGQKPTSRSNQRHQLPNEENPNSGQKATSLSNQRHQLPNEGNPNSGQKPTVTSHQMHQLHNFANTNSGINTTAGSQGKIIDGVSTPTKTKTVNTGLSASTIFGIVAGCLIGSWMVLGPMICLVCKYRDSHREKKKRFNQRLHQSDSNNGITEAMIMSELGKDPLNKRHYKVKVQQRESTHSDTFHDAYETPPLLL